jgi:hypothetical protein
MDSTNIRQLANFNDSYVRINREERNLAAIFYHVLLQKNNLKQFLDYLNVDYPIVREEIGIYFEYAFLRDLWHHIGSDTKYNNTKRNLIIESLKPVNADYLKDCSIKQFNEYFGAVPVPSSEYIQSPSNWSIMKFTNNVESDDEFLKICEYKWCYNAKPDIVIHTSNDQAILIEAKLESGEGKYPSSKKELEEFKHRNIDPVKQTYIQQKIMELLGVESKLIFLVEKRAKSATHKTILWKEAFDVMDTNDCPLFIQAWLDRLNVDKG